MKEIILREHLEDFTSGVVDHACEYFQLKIMFVRVCLRRQQNKKLPERQRRHMLLFATELLH
jgi:hypothetical protein